MLYIHFKLTENKSLKFPTSLYARQKTAIIVSLLMTLNAENNGFSDKNHSSTYYDGESVEKDSSRVSRSAYASLGEISNDEQSRQNQTVFTAPIQSSDSLSSIQLDILGETNGTDDKNIDETSSIRYPSLPSVSVDKKCDDNLESVCGPFWNVDNDDDSDLVENELDHFSWPRVRGLICVSLKRNLVPAIILNLFAVLILVLYYTTEPVNSALSYLGTLKVKYGIRYSFVVTSIFGGIVPYLFVLLTGPPSVRRPAWIFTRFFWFATLWGLRGIELDYLYKFQAFMFGDDQKVSTIAFKTMFDEFVYSIIWVAWFLTFISRLEINNFRIRYTCRRTIASKRWWINEVVVTNVAAWIVWVPACIAIYALSLNLQTTLLNIVLVFWVLLVRVISASKSPEKVASVEANEIEQEKIDIDASDVGENLSAEETDLDAQVPFQRNKEGYAPMI